MHVGTQSTPLIKQVSPSTTTTATSSNAQSTILRALCSVRGRGKSGLEPDQRAQLEAAVSILEVLCEAVCVHSE